MKKDTAPKTWLVKEVIDEMQKRYPDVLTMKEQSQFDHGVDVGYQACINEMISIIEGEDDSTE